NSLDRFDGLALVLGIRRVAERLTIGIGQRFAEEGECFADAPRLGGERLSFDFHFRQFAGGSGGAESDNSDNKQEAAPDHGRTSPGELLGGSSVTVTLPAASCKRPISHYLLPR